MIASYSTLAGIGSIISVELVDSSDYCW